MTAADKLAALAEIHGGIYARQSRNRKMSIQDQIEEGLERFQGEGWPEPMVFRDGKGASRHSVGSRDDWPKVVELMETGQLNLLWLWEQSRGGRVAWEFIRVLETCAELGILIYIEEHERLFDLDNDGDWDTLASQAVKDQAESDKIQRRIERSKRRARARGNLRRVLGHQPPIGYRDGDEDWVTDPRHRDLLGEVARAMLPPFRQTLAEAFATWSLASGPVYRNLSGGVQGRRITVKDLHRALRNPVTAALLTGPPVKRKDGQWSGRGKIIGQVKVQGGPPLDRETWEELQRMFAEQSAGRAPADEYPLGKVFACAYCGNQLSGKIHYGQRAAGPKLIPSYSCANPHKIPGSSPPRYIKPCRKVTIPADEANEVLRVAVAAWWTEHEAEFAHADLAGESSNAELERERALLTERRAHAEHQRQVFARKWADDEPGWTEEFYEEMDASAARAVARAQAELDELDAQAERARDEEAAAREGRLPSEIENWAGLSAEEQQRWVRKAFVTPIKVIKAYGTGRKLATDERLILVNRDLS